MHLANARTCPDASASLAFNLLKYCSQACLQGSAPCGTLLSGFAAPCPIDAVAHLVSYGIPPVQGLWRGTVPGLLLTVPYTAVQFAALQEARAAAQKWGLMETSLAPAVSFVSGAVAGAAATVASYPFDLLRTTLAAQGEPKVRLHVRQKL